MGTTKHDLVNQLQNVLRLPSKDTLNNMYAVADQINTLFSSSDGGNLLSPQNLPEKNALLVISIYDKLLSTFMDFVNKESFQTKIDELLLKCLDGSRFPVASGGRLNFSFSTTFAVGDLPFCTVSIYALILHNIKFCNTLLMEQRVSWGSDASIIKRDSTLNAGGDDLNWFHQVVSLCVEVYTKYKDVPGKQPLLREYFQNVIQIIDEVLQVHDEEQRSDLILKLRQFFRKKENKATSALAVVKYFDSSNVIDKLPESKEISRIINAMGLTSSAVLERKTRLEQLLANTKKPAERLELKRFLKTRFHLSVLMFDRILFEQCISDCSAIRLEAFTETIIELAHQNSKNMEALFYLQRSFTKEQVLDVVYYLLQNNNAGESGYVGEIKTHSPEVREFIDRLVVEIIGTHGDIKEQLGLVGSLIAHINQITFDNQRRLIFISNLFRCIYKHSIALDLFGASFFDKNNSLGFAESKELEHYPGLREHFPSNLGSVHEAIVQRATLISTIKEVDFKVFCNGFWLTYISSMWFELNHISVVKNQALFPIIDYFLEYLLKNAKEYPNLLPVLESVLIENDYFSNAKLRYFLKYRFGENRKVASRILIEENLRVARKQFDFDANEFVVYEHDELPGVITEALESRSKSIYAQLDFLNQLNALTEQRVGEKTHYKHSGVFELILKLLIKRIPPIAKLFSDLDRPLGESVNELLNPRHESHIEPEGFDTPVVRDTLLLYLFLNKHMSKTGTVTGLLHYINSVLVSLSMDFDSSEEKSKNYSAFHDELAKHRFFIREVGNILCSIFFDPILLQLASTEFDLSSRYTISGVKKVSAALIEEPKSESETKPEIDLSIFDDEEKAPKKKKKRSKAKKAEPQPVSAEVIDQEPVPSPIIELPETEIIAAQAPDPVIEPEPEQYLSLDDVPQEELPTEPEVLEEPSLSRQIRQKISVFLERFIKWNAIKLNELGHDKRLIFQYQNLADQLEQYKGITHSIRNKIKGKQPQKFKSLVFELADISDENLLENFQNYTLLVEQLKALNSDVELISLITQLAALEYLDLLQPALHQRLKLPAEMPVINYLITLFSSHAQLLVYGSALFMENPLDIDIKLLWTNPESSLEEMKLCFIQIMNAAGFETIFVAELSGGVSFKINAKGDDYSLEQHKELGITVLVADPKLRPEQLHHNSHSAAAYDVLAKKIYCDKEAAEQIIQGVFTLGSHQPQGEKEQYRMKVHMLTSLMRACAEPLVLDVKSKAQIEDIVQYKGDWEALRSKNFPLEEALRGVIKRHITHYQVGETYKKRTDILFDFLTKLELHSTNRLLRSWLKEHLNSIQDMKHYTTVLGIGQKLGIEFRTQDNLRLFYNSGIPERVSGFPQSRNLQPGM